MSDAIDFPDFPDFDGSPGDFEIEFDEDGTTPGVAAKEPPLRIPSKALDNAAIDEFFNGLGGSAPAPISPDRPKAEEEAFTVISAADVRSDLEAAAGKAAAEEEDGDGFIIEFGEDSPDTMAVAPEPAAAAETAVAPQPVAIEEPIAARGVEYEDSIEWEDEPFLPAAPLAEAPVGGPEVRAAPRVTGLTSPAADLGTALTISEGDRPSWLRELIEKSESSVSHAFLLDFNIKDYAYRRVGVRDLVAHTLNQMNHYHIVAYYNLADGLHFPSWGEGVYRERLLEFLGRGEKIRELQEDEIQMAEMAELARRTGKTLDELKQEAIATQSEFPDRPEQVLELLRPLFEQPTLYSDSEEAFPSIFFWIDSVETILPDQPLSQMKLEERKMLMTLREISESKAADGGKEFSGNLLVMTAESAQDVQESLRYASSRVETVTLPLPDRQERLKFILEDVAAMASSEDEPLFGPDLDAEVLANLSAGLSKTQIEDIALRAQTRGGTITEQLVKERKADIIRSEYADVIEILDPAYSFSDIGGLEHVKSYFREDVIEPIRCGDFSMAPQGVLLVGPAGTGKTMVAQALAFESQMNCVNLDLSKILNRWVGSSERNFEKALRCIRSMEPTIVIVEEIDEAFPTRGADSTGVSSRIFKRFLEFMGDPTKRGKVLVIATSNYPSRMDAALRRPGRFDKKIPFFVPDPLGRLRIMHALALRMGYGIQLPDIAGGVEEGAARYQSLKAGMDAANDAAREAVGSSIELDAKTRQLLDLRFILANTEGMTGAEIETILQKAATAVYRRKLPSGDGIRLADLKQACEVIVPSTSAISEMTEEALRECNDLEFVPAELWDRVRAAKSELLTGVGPLNAAGSLLTS